MLPGIKSLPKPQDILAMPLQMVSQTVGMLSQVATLPLQIMQSFFSGEGEFTQTMPTTVLDKRNIFGA